MKQFEDKLQASAQRLARQENRSLHVPENPMQQKRAYWGWVATPAAAVAGLVIGMSLHLIMGSHPDAALAQRADTIRIFQPVHDTLYLTQVVEKERVIEKRVPVAVLADAQLSAPKAPTQDSLPEECTSIRCDGINYAILASK